MPDFKRSLQLRPILRPVDGVFAQSANKDLRRLVDFVNSAYRGESSKAGRAWTTEADLLGGQRVDLLSLQELLSHEGRSSILLLESESDLLACVHMRLLENKIAYLGMLTVSPKHQNCGLGRELLQRAEAWCQTQWQARGIEMTVIDIRKELIEWYQRRGYETTGERRPFPYGNVRFGEPRRPDLEFVVLQKTWSQPKVP